MMPNLNSLAVRLIGGGIALLILIGAFTYLVHDRNHWKSTATLRQQQLVETKAAFDQTVASYRAAAVQAKAADAANANRVKTEQSAINERTSDDYQTRIAAARADAQRLRNQQAAATHSGARGATPVPGVPASVAGSSQAAGEDGLSDSDKLTATEQAIQLDELIKWVRNQAAVDVNGQSAPPH